MPLATEPLSSSSTTGVRRVVLHINRTPAPNGSRAVPALGSLGSAVVPAPLSLPTGSLDAGPTAVGARGKASWQTTYSAAATPSWIRSAAASAGSSEMVAYQRYDAIWPT